MSRGFAYECYDTNLLGLTTGKSNDERTTVPYPTTYLVNCVSEGNRSTSDIERVSRPFVCAQTWRKSPVMHHAPRDAALASPTATAPAAIGTKIAVRNTDSDCITNIAPGLVYMGYGHIQWRRDHENENDESRDR
jgi:hypothetical protein